MNTLKRFVLCVFLLVVGVMLTGGVVSISETVAWAAWSNDPSVNTPISTAADYQRGQQIISDGADGAIIVWYDYRNGNEDIYAQRIDANGNALWTANGVAICTASGDQSLGTIMSDGSGGAIIAWSDGRNGNWDIYAQRINSNGVAQWTANGVAITTLAASQSGSVMTSDGAGGAIIAWSDGRNGNEDIYAQRIDANGNAQWVADGVAVVTAANSQGGANIASDEAGGAIIVWSDYRSGSKYDLYAQRINSAAVIQWAINGVAVNTASGDQFNPGIIKDGSGGAFIGWSNSQNVNNSSLPYNVYMQRINSNGAVQWAAGGVAITALTGPRAYIGLVSDAAGGIIISWDDQRPGAGGVYAQRVDTNGNLLWTTNGIAVSTMFSQTASRIASDGSGGAIIVWSDTRNGANNDIYAQRVNSSGSALWTTNGIAVSTVNGQQQNPMITASASGEAIIVWQDTRNGGSNSDIYAQRVNNSFAGLSATAIAQEQGPTGTSTTYDGNGDGVPDVTQSNVTSLFTGATNNATTYVTMAVTTASGTSPTISTAAKTTTQDESGLNLTVGGSGKLPLGTLSFQLTSVQPSVENIIKMYLPTGVHVNKVFKYGATPDNHAAHWYDFTCNPGHPVKPCGEVSTESNGRKVVTLYLIDGQIGDDDYTVNGTIKDDVAFAAAPVTCMIPLLATGDAATWCTVTNGSSNDSTMTFTVLGYLGKNDSNTVPGAVSISTENSPHKGESVVYYFKGRNIYKGFSMKDSVVVTETSLASLPATGAGFYAAKLSIDSSTASVDNVLMSCFQLDPKGSKRPLIVNCN